MSAITYLNGVSNALREPFLPTVGMNVYFGANALINSCELTKDVVQNAPRVLIGGQPDEFYTLIMFDPDAPNPSDPCFRQLVSWIVINIPGGASCAQGSEITSYVGPYPQIGIHRYILFLYKQQSRINDMNAIGTRLYFNCDAFADQHNLGNPVAMTYFNVRSQPNGRNARA